MEHSCEAPDYTKEPPRRPGFYGNAIQYCSEDAEGYFWADNGEYVSYVLYCPFCGMKGREYGS